MQMGYLSGWMDRVELVLMRVRSSTHKWKWKEFYNKGWPRLICWCASNGGSFEFFDWKLGGANLHPSIHAWYPCSWPRGYRLSFPGYRPIFVYFFRLKSGNSQDESVPFPGHFMVHQLIAGGLKLQSDCHLMIGNLDRPWGEIHWLIMN